MAEVNTDGGNLEGPAAIQSLSGENAELVGVDSIVMESENSEKDCKPNGKGSGNVAENPHIALNWLENHTINNKIRIARLNYLGHIIRSDEGGILKTAMEYKLPLTKKRGRPAHPVRNNMFNDIERSGIPMCGTRQLWIEGK